MWPKGEKDSWEGEGTSRKGTDINMTKVSESSIFSLFSTQPQEEVTTTLDKKGEISWDRPLIAVSASRGDHYEFRNNAEPDCKRFYFVSFLIMYVCVLKQAYTCIAVSA